MKNNLVDLITANLCAYAHPLLPVGSITNKTIHHIACDPEQRHITIAIVVNYPCNTVKEQVLAALHDELAKLVPDYTINLSLTWRIAEYGTLNVPAVPNIKNIIAIAAGKGGVGKSSVALNLALALQQEGAAVGLLDADIYGPSQPLLLNSIERLRLGDDKKIMPVSVYGIEFNSMGLLLDAAEPVIWRGPMIALALKQLLMDTKWSNLDYLIIDLPPGTGDIQLSLAQKHPLTAAVMVTTPQALAVQDVRRAAAMLVKLSVPLLGIIENMAHYECPSCHASQAVFGSGGAAILAEELNMPVLMSLPLDPVLGANATEPFLLSMPQHYYAHAYRAAARQLAARLAQLPRSYKHKFPSIRTVTS